MDKIEITYVEFDNALASNSLAVGQLYYAQWRRNDDHQYAWADPARYDDAPSPESGEVRGIPDDVRVALALLVAPGLVVAVPMAEET